MSSEFFFLSSNFSYDNILWYSKLIRLLSKLAYGFTLFYLKLKDKGGLINDLEVDL